MTKQNYNYVDYKCYEAKLGKQVSVCRIYLIEGNLVYEGPEAGETKKMIEENPRLAPLRGYELLSALCEAYQGSYNYITVVQGPKKE